MKAKRKHYFLGSSGPHLSIFSVCFAFMAFFSNTAEAKATAFALIGDPHHSPDTIRTALTQTLVTEAGISIDFTTDTAQLKATNLNGYRLLILFKDGVRPDYSFWMTAAQGTAIKRFAENGGSILFYHESSYLALTNDSVKAVFGGVYAGHPVVREFALHITDTNSPITKGVSDFTVTDEQHYPVYYADSSHIFMVSVNTNGLTFKDDNGVQRGTTAIAGWAFPYGAGKVCYIAPGHTLLSLRNPEYVKIQKNAVAWLLLPSTAVLRTPARIPDAQKSALSIRNSGAHSAVIDYSATINGRTQISFYNAMGRRIATMQESVVPGVNSYLVPASLRGVGMILCVVQTNGFRLMRYFAWLQ
jgi:type 1 glutamine amidotransferase